MKKEELRIGNLVYAGVDENDQSVACVITQLKNRGIVWKSVGDPTEKGGNYTSYKSIDTIEITPTILEKAGFTNYRYWWSVPKFNTFCFEQWTNDCFGLYLNVNQIKVGLHIRFLHEFQNMLFSLTGEELQINLK